MRHFTKVFLSILVILISVQIAIGAGSVTMTINKYTTDVDVLTVNFTADASDGSIPAMNTTGYYPNPRRNKVGYISLVSTVPGSTAPTDDYDIALESFTEGHVDIMGNTLDDRDDTNAEQSTPKIGTVYGGRIVPGIINVVTSGNSVNSATGTIYIIFAY